MKFEGSKNLVGLSKNQTLKKRELITKGLV